MSIPEKFLNSEKYLLQIKIEKLMLQQSNNKNLKVRMSIPVRKNLL